MNTHSNLYMHQSRMERNYLGVISALSAFIVLMSQVYYVNAVGAEGRHVKGREMDTAEAPIINSINIFEYRKKFKANPSFRMYRKSKLFSESSCKAEGGVTDHTLGQLTGACMESLNNFQG